MGALSVLPALDVKTPQQPNLLEQYGQLQALRGNQQQMQQRAALAPLQQQEAQQSVQQGGLDIQQKQQALKDQQAVTAAMSQWDGKDLNELSPLILKNGGSGQAVIGLRQKQLELQSKAAETFKAQADGGKALVETQKRKNDMLQGGLTPLTDPTQVPDAQLPQALDATVQDLLQKGLLDPQGAQQAEQLKQSGDPNAIRSGIKLFINSHQALSQIVEQAQKTAQTQEAQSATSKNSAETNYYKQNGGAPGVSVDTQELNSYLKNHPGKTAEDFARFKASLSPLAVVMGNQLGGQQNAAGLDLAADNYRKTGQMAPEISRSPGTVMAIINRAAQMDQQAGGGGIASNKADLKSYSDALAKLQTGFSQTQAFEQTAEKNMDLLKQTAAKIPDLGARFANVPVRMISGSMIGTDNMAAFKTALATAQTEAAKVLNSASGNGMLSDSSRHELQDIIDGNLPLSAMTASLNTLKQDMANRNTAYQQQISDLQGRIKGVGSNGTPAASAGKAVGTTSKPDGIYEKDGKRYTVKGGQVYE